MKVEVEEVASAWGLDVDLVLRSANAFDVKNPVIPYVDEITKNMDYGKAIDQSAGNRLKHNMMILKELPKVLEVWKQKYE